MKNKDFIDFVEKTWDELTVSIDEDTETHIGLPNPFVAPSVHMTEGFMFREQFYWDTYFIIRALVKTDRKKLAEGMVNNLLYLQKTLGYVANSNNKSHMGRSQPPLLSSMVLEVYSFNKNKKWLGEAYELLIDEYENVWNGDDRLTETGLSRYYNEDETNHGAEDESGWDYTTRFESRSLDFLPVDLNCLLYLYERNLMLISSEIGKEHEVIDWAMKSDQRKILVNKLLWSKKDGMFYDYDFKARQLRKVDSLATFVPLFTGLASGEQARRIMMNLDKFETPFGVTTTNKNDPKVDGKQWASPNGWAPLHLFVVEGLEKYGYRKQAKSIKEKWVKNVVEKFNETHQLYEKYNVVSPNEKPAHAVYPDQVGFAWTNAVTYLFLA